jgi:hypothetical protein
VSAPSTSPDGPSEIKRSAIALASLVFGVAASAAYAAQRLFERSRSGPVDPLLIVFDLHTAFYWRATTATWWGVIAAIATYAFAAQPGAATLRERLTRVLAWSAVPFAIALALAMWRNP